MLSVFHPFQRRASAPRHGAHLPRRFRWGPGGPSFHTQGPQDTPMMDLRPPSKAAPYPSPEDLTRDQLAYANACRAEQERLGRFLLRSEEYTVAVRVYLAAHPWNPVATASKRG